MVNRLVIAGFFGAALFAFGQPVTYEIDPSQTTVAFTLGDILHTVHGGFKLKSGEIRFDASTGAASGEVVVDAASGNSGNTARDSRMHKSILESAQYPWIIFRPDHFEGKLSPQASSQIQVHGIFSIHGVDHEITTPAQVQASAGQLSATLRFAVPYVKWGMKNPSTLFLRVKDTVEIEIHAFGRVTSAPAPR